MYELIVHELKGEGRYKAEVRRVTRETGVERCICTCPVYYSEDSGAVPDLSHISYKDEGELSL